MSTAASIEKKPTVEPLVIDLERTCLHEAFFARFRFATFDEYLRAAAQEPMDLAELSQTAELREAPYSGWSYWMIHLKGYAEYLLAGGVEPENTYLRYLRDYYAPQVQDPGLAAGFDDAQEILTRVKNRFAGFDFFREHEGQPIGARVLPVRAITSDPPRREPLLLFAVGSETPIVVRLIDGWHRLFAGKLCRIPDLRCSVEAENKQAPVMHGSIERASVEDDRLIVSGWCVAPEEVTLVELRAGGETLACCEVSPRPDVERHLSAIPHARMSGFTLTRSEFSAQAAGPLTLLGLNDWLPVGLLDLVPASGARAYVSERQAAVSTPVKDERDSDPPRLSTEIAEGDQMFTGDRNHYFSVGRSALRAIRLAMQTAESGMPATILDLPCGHARVLRWLRAEFPDAAITACDLLKAGVDHCAAAFGATPVYSEVDPAKIPLRGTFDLIWVGSLLTHLDEAGFTAFLSRFQSLLAPRGLVVFTTHGRYVRGRLSSGTNTYGLEHGNVASVIDSYDRTGFGYADYPRQPGFGISVSSPSWVLARIEELSRLQIVSFTERGWDRHQDVVACMGL